MKKFYVSGIPQKRGRHRIKSIEPIGRYEDEILNTHTVYRVWINCGYVDYYKGCELKLKDHQGKPCTGYEVDSTMNSLLEALKILEEED